MINFSTNQRRSVRWDSKWIEEVLAASGVEADDSTFNAISGSHVQELFEATDNVLEGIDYSTASGVVAIEDVSNVSGTVGGTLGDLDVITLGDASDSVFRFSFTVGAQPVDPVNVRVLYAVRGTGTGNLRLVMDYNLFEQGDDLDPGSFAETVTGNASVLAAAEDDMKLMTLAIPLVAFSTGSAPMIASCQVTRDTSVGSNIAEDVSVVALYADNVPGGVNGNTAGYIGGNLTVDGNLTVEGLAIFEGGTAPASASDTGTSGTLIIDDDFIYCAVATNTWKRTPLATF